MSKQHLTATQREALWEAHGRKCFHCPKELTLGEMRADHLIPESTSKVVLVGLKKQGIVPDNFSLTGPENWVPACDDCNGTKHDIIFKPGYLHGRVIAVQRRLPKYHEQVGRKRQRKSVDRIARDAARGIGSGEFTRSDVIKAIRAIEAVPSGPATPRKTALINTRLSAHQLQLARRAKLDVNTNGLTLADFASILQSAVETGAFKTVADHARPGRISLRLTSSLRVVLHVRRGEVVVERVLFR